MRIFLFNIYFFLLITSCVKKDKVSLLFVNEHVIGDSIAFKNTIIGGISGVDFFENNYFFVVDDAKSPRFLKVSIEISNNKIQAVNFKDVIFLADSTTQFYYENALDLESIFIDEKTKEVNFTSEGNIHKGKYPVVFTTDFNGNFLRSYQLPSNLYNLQTIKHNGVLEGSTKSIDQKGFWTIMEAPLNSDGAEPSFIKQSSPVRLTYFNNNSKKATKQFAYQLEHITKPAKSSINLNGVTAILEYQKNHFFIIERAYQSGYGPYGNTVRIFDAEINNKTTNILEIDSLKTNNFIPLRKRLLLDFETVKEHLTEGIIDNIEGITFGPVLENGNQSLLLVSDDNFQIYGKQLNQFILLEIVRE